MYFKLFKEYIYIYILIFIPRRIQYTIHVPVKDELDINCTCNRNEGEFS